MSGQTWTLTRIAACVFFIGGAVLAGIAISKHSAGCGNCGGGSGEQGEQIVYAGNAGHEEATGATPVEYTYSCNCSKAQTAAIAGGLVALVALVTLVAEYRKAKGGTAKAKGGTAEGKGIHTEDEAPGLEAGLVQQAPGKLVKKKKQGLARAVGAVGETIAQGSWV